MGWLVVNPLWVVFIAALFYVNPGGSFWPFMTAGCLHEGGHLAVLFLSRTRVYQVKLQLNGAVIATAPMSRGVELLCAAAGPMVNLLTFVFADSLPLLRFWSLTLACFNLLPMYPLDGGRMVLTAFGERVAAVSGALTCLVLVMAGVYATCVLHWGIWPCMVSGFSVFRLLETAQRENKSCKNIVRRVQ